MKASNNTRYDLPSSRILIRTLRRVEKRFTEIVGDDRESPESESIFDQILSMAMDLFVVRLLEETGTLPDRYLVHGKRARKLTANESHDRLAAFNQWAGWEVFDLGPWRGPGPGDELSILDHEIHLNRFWPPGMTAETLGALWEERLPSQKRHGVFYTPRSIVDHIVTNSLALWFEDGHAGPPHLIDPACGGGYFLLAALREISGREMKAIGSGRDLFSPLIESPRGELTLSPEGKMEIIGEFIHGVDIDGAAIELARKALFIEVISGVEAFSRPSPSFAPLLKNLKVGDSVLEQSFPQQAELFALSSPPPLSPFDWRDRESGFGEILENGGFSLVIGNPPWISLKGRRRQTPYSSGVIRHLIERYDADTYRPNIVEFFIRRSLEVLSEGGINGFVVPDRVAENVQFGPLREFMLEKGELVSLHFREPFPGVVADTLIYVFRKRTKPRKSLKIKITDHCGSIKTAPQSFWTKTGGRPPVEKTDDEVENILRKIETAGRRQFADFFETGVGFIAKSRRITEEKDHDLQRRVIKGEHISPYFRTGNAWFEFTLTNLAGGTRNLKKLEKPDRILLRKTGARIIAARDQSGFLPEQSLYFAFPRDRRLARAYDINYFLGILNSRVMSFYFRHRKITNRASTPQIKKVHLDSLPIRPIHFKDSEATKLYESMTEAVAKRSAQNAENHEKLDTLIDEVAAKLYGLGEKDLKIIESHMNKGW